MYEQEAREAVARGLAWIKANAETLNLDPSRIDPESINVENDHDCVLASAGGRSFDEIMSDADHPDEDFHWVTRQGFAYPGWGPEAEQRNVAICNEWRRVILADRQPEAPVGTI